MALAAASGPRTDRWRRATEWFVFAVPVAAGLGVAGYGLAAGSTGHLPAGAAVEVLARRPLVAVAGLAAVVVAGLGWTVALAAAVYLDAAAVEAGDTDWDPRGPAYAALVAVLPVAALCYLRRRHRHAGPATGGERWWLGFPLATLVLVLPFAGVRWSAVPPAVVLLGAGLALTFFPIAAYRDAAHVRHRPGTWRPDPALHFALAVVATLFAFPQPVYTAYYLWRRRRTTRAG